MNKKHRDISKIDMLTHVTDEPLYKLSESGLPLQMTSRWQKHTSVDSNLHVTCWTWLDRKSVLPYFDHSNHTCAAV